MAKKNLIEDSPELQAALDDLKKKTGETSDKEMIRDTVIEKKADIQDGIIPDETDENVVDTFEERVQEIVPEDSIGEAVMASEKERKEKRARNREESKVKKHARDKERVKDHAGEEESEEEKAARHSKARAKRRKRAKEEEVVISMEGVSKSYIKGVPALNDVNLQIRKGEFVFIVGGTGSGKSTLIRLLLREMLPSSGHIMVNGFQVEKLRRWRIPKLRRSIGVVFQDFRLLQDRSVYENVAFAQRIIQVPAREMKRNVPDMLATVGLAGKYKAKPKELSGGEQQRVALARALVNKPPILLCDEPTGNLDPKTTEEIMSLLERINKNGTTVVVVTHNEKIVNDMQKRVITIKKGVIISDEEKGGYLDED